MLMHGFIFLSLCLLKIVPAYSRGLGLGEKCETHRQCRSQHCVRICSGIESICVQPVWFNLRHGLKVPECIEPDLLKARSPLQNKRMVGETCHHDKNCYSNKCIPLCGSNGSIWKCVESKSYYEEKKIKAPTCFEEAIIEMNDKENNKDNDSSKIVDLPKEIRKTELEEIQQHLKIQSTTSNSFDSKQKYSNENAVEKTEEMETHPTEMKSKEDVEEIHDHVKSPLDGQNDAVSIENSKKKKAHPKKTGFDVQEEFKEIYEYVKDQIRAEKRIRNLRKDIKAPQPLSQESKEYFASIINGDVKKERMGFFTHVTRIYFPTLFNWISKQ